MFSILDSDERGCPVILTILDTGCRITELLSAATTDFDLDNLLLTVYGKGRKERRVPMSIDLRRILFRWGQVKERAKVTSPLMFPLVTVADGINATLYAATTA